jgi:predicted Zn-dependent protease
MARCRPLLAGLAACLLAGCGGGDPDYTAEIGEAERRQGAEQHPQLLAEFGGAYRESEAAYVARIGEKLAETAGLGGQCTFTLVNTDVVNAFAVPGCYIYVTRGLMSIVNSEAELASVLGHELGHIVADHGERQQKRSILRSLGVLAVALITDSERLTEMAGRAAEFFTLRYSRSQEYESDDLGIRYLKDAGYDPHAAADMLDALGRQERFLASTRGRDEAQGIPEWARTHPLAENRTRRARETASATGIADGTIDEKEAAYLGEVDGLLYGDDPQQGFVIGRRFEHPQMRIGFEAPEGFTLTNSPQAILISGPEGVQGEFGGGRMPAGGLDQYMKALIAGLLKDAPAEVGEPVRSRINGVPSLVTSVSVQTRDGIVQLSLAAYDAGGGAAYHFILVSPPGADGGAAADALFGSFRRLTPEQAASLRARQIRVVRAAPGDSLQSLARRMASEHPLEHLLMLNDRSADQPLKPGESLKIVTVAGAGG